MFDFITAKIAGIFALLMGLVQGVMLWLAYSKGKDATTIDAQKKALEGARKANEEMDKIRKLSDDALNDKLRR